MNIENQNAYNAAVMLHGKNFSMAEAVEYLKGLGPKNEEWDNQVLELLERMLDEE